MNSFDKNSANLILQQLLVNPAHVQKLHHPLPQELSQYVIEKLKEHAEENDYKDRKLSLALADCIVTIAEKRGDHNQIALGQLAYGNALWQLGDYGAAWEKLETAGQAYLKAANQYGWARTRISRLYISINLKSVHEALQDAYEAENIFLELDDCNMLLRLYLNWGAALNFKGEYNEALAKFQQALNSADLLDNQGGAYRGMVYLNKGYSFNYLGDFYAAIKQYAQAKDVFITADLITGLFIAENNTAHIEILQGHYRQALSRLVQIEQQMTREQKNEHAHALREMIECYLALDRYDQAQNVAQQMISDYRDNKADFQMAQTMLYLAIANAGLGKYAEAHTALEETETIFRALKSEVWLATVKLRQAQIAYKQGDTSQVLAIIDIIIPVFLEYQQQVNVVEATLLRSQALFDEQRLEEAGTFALDALQMAERYKNPTMRYNALLILGHLANACEQPQRALRRYASANRIIERIQRRLTITMQSSFLANKNEALHHLIKSQLELGKIREAFNTLERSKSQIWQEYILNREQLRWDTTDEQTKALIVELDRLREEYHWYYRITSGKHDEQTDRAKVSMELAMHELGRCERRMRAITEALYLQAGQTVQRTATLRTLADIQEHIDDNSVVIEYYNNSNSLWAFIISFDAIDICLLDTTLSEIDNLQKNLYLNINRALRVGPMSPVSQTLRHLFNKIAKKLYQKLLVELPEKVKQASRLVIVPYGSLHYVPFQLLHNGQDYCIGNQEIVVLPNAGMLAEEVHKQSGKALILAHSNYGKLPNVLQEAKRIGYLLECSVYYEKDAKRETLLKTPTQILHIATHGEFRINQPEFSYFQLDDGQLFADDLMQYDLSYELVTLSACETWRSYVTPGDELVGLGRGILYAGADSLIASLWRVEDSRTERLMEKLYSELKAGASRAQALKTAQNSLRAAEPNLHPAYWGAFELIGQAGPLSHIN